MLSSSVEATKPTPGTYRIQGSVCEAGHLSDWSLHADRLEVLKSGSLS